MKSKEEIKQWLLANCVDERGDLNLIGLDFSDFEGDIFIGDMKVNKNLYQDNQAVVGHLFQNFQVVGCTLYQEEQEVGQHLYQHRQTVKGDLWQGRHKVNGKLYDLKR